MRALPTLLLIAFTLGILTSGADAAASRTDPLVRERLPGTQRTPAATVSGVPDPHLEPGFPVLATDTPGTFHAGPAIHTLVTNLDTDPEAEIVVTGLALGPVYAWNHDGTPVLGWPLEGGGAGYAAAGRFAGLGAGVAIGFWGGDLSLVDGQGAEFPGWPRPISNYIATPPSVADVGGGAEDEIFGEEEDWELHAYSFDGSPLPGWPVSGDGGQERHTPAIGDIDGDPGLEIVTCSGSTTPGVYLYAYEADGSVVPGFPVNIEPLGYGTVDAFPVIGDVDGDGQPEIVAVNRRNQIRIYSGSGALEAVHRYCGTFFYSTAPALADFDGDGTPEIVVQTNDSMSVVRGNGSAYPGWPIALGNFLWLGNSSPAVGDVDGDGDPDVVITVQEAGSSGGGELRAYDRSGTMLAGFPKSLPLGAGAVPAIADLDLDGRNEIVATADYWDGLTGNHPKVWAFDLGGPAHGPIHWGQFMHDAGHTGVYRPPPPVAVGDGNPRSPARWTAAPNPARAGAVVVFDGPAGAATVWTVVNIAGQRVRQLGAAARPAWDGRDMEGRLVPPGAYFARSDQGMVRVVFIR